MHDIFLGLDKFELKNPYENPINLKKYDKINRMLAFIYLVNPDI